MMNTLSFLDGLAARGGLVGMEHPDDPGMDPYPSIWSTAEMLNLIIRRCLGRRHLDQCMCKGPCKKPTCVTGNMPGLDGSGPFCDGQHVHEKSVGRSKTGAFLSQRLSLYPSGFCELIAGWFLAGFLAMLKTGAGPTGWRRSAEPIARISNWSTVPSSVRDEGVAFLNEHEVRGTKTIVDSQQHAFYLHVDDGIFVSDSDSNANRLMQ